MADSDSDDGIQRITRGHSARRAAQQQRTATIHAPVASRASDDGISPPPAARLARPPPQRGASMSPGALQLSVLERGLSAGPVASAATPSAGAGQGSGASSPQSISGRSSAVDSDACRPSPQLLAAMHSLSPRNLLAHSSDEAAVPTLRGSAAARAALSPPQQVAGRLPPAFALERPVVPLVQPTISRFGVPASAAGSAAIAAGSTVAAAASSFSSAYWPPLGQARSDSPTTSSGPSTPPVHAQQSYLAQQMAMQQLSGSRGRSYSQGNRSDNRMHTSNFQSNLTPPLGAVSQARRALLLRHSFDGLQLLQLQHASARHGGGGGGGGGDRGSGEQNALDGEDSEDQQLIPSSRVLRQRAHSNDRGSNPQEVMPLLQEHMGAWSSKGSRALIYCASGILFLLISCFFAVVALRLAAAHKYTNQVCVLRNEERQRMASRPPAVANIADVHGAREHHEHALREAASRWVPNYAFSTWDRDWFTRALRAKMARERGPASWAEGAIQSAWGHSSLFHEPPLDPPALEEETSSKVAALFAAGGWLASLRLHHFKVMGTHNSYHLASNLPLSMHQYSHASLPAQLDSYRKGVRQLELDLHIIPQEGDASASSSSDISKPAAAAASATAKADSSSPPGFVVYHLQWLDDRTTCYCLSECLDLISDWSSRHPLHFPVYLAFEIKAQLYEDIDTGLRGVSCKDLENVEKEILAVLPRERLITPEDVRGGPGSPFATVREALRAAAALESDFASKLSLRRRLAKEDGSPLVLPSPGEYPNPNFGWPRLTDALGKIVLIWLDDTHNMADTLDCMVPPQVETGAGAGAAATTAGDAQEPSTPAGAAAATPVAASAPADAAAAAAASLYTPDWFHRPERVIFIAQNSLEASYAAVVTAKHPAEAMDSGVIRQAMELGMLVRTMSDESRDMLPDRARFAAALHCGAHMITTDFEECIERESGPDEAVNGVDAEGAIPDDAAPTQTDSDAPAAAPPTTKPTATPSARSTAARARASSRLPRQTHVHGESHAPFAAALSSLLPWVHSHVTLQHAADSGNESPADASAVASISASPDSSGTSSVYCEHLPSEWPFECNDLSAPFFCEAALEALRVQKELWEWDHLHQA